MRLLPEDFGQTSVYTEVLPNMLSLIRSFPAPVASAYIIPPSDECMCVAGPDAGAGIAMLHKLKQAEQLLNSQSDLIDGEDSLISI